MLLHLPHFCNSLFTSSHTTWPEHGVHGAAGRWRRPTAWSARPACLPPWHTRRSPGGVPQHTSPTVCRRRCVPTGEILSYLLAQRRAALPPAELAALEAAQHARLVAEGTPEYALRMGVQAAVDQVLAARAGLPSFEDWRQMQEACG
jgi:hypothetical protein